MFDRPKIESKPKSDFHFEGISITPDHPFVFPASAKKEPIEIKSGDEIGANSIKVVIEGAVADIMKEAESLKGIPETERLSALMKLVREKLIYPYSEVIDSAKKEGNKLAPWLEKRFGNRPIFLHSEINEYLENGYGDCKIMAVLYLLVAQATGLKGIYANNVLPIKNLERPDTKQPIFKSIGVNEEMLSHAWVEIQLQDGAWVPIDVSTKMVGTGDMFKFFKEAGYNTPILFEVEGEPRELQINREGLVFNSGESERKIEISMGIRRTSNFVNKKYNVPAVEEFKGNVDLKFYTPKETKTSGVQISPI